MTETDRGDVAAAGMALWLALDEARTVWDGDEVTLWSGTGEPPPGELTVSVVDGTGMVVRRFTVTVTAVTEGA